MLVAETFLAGLIWGFVIASVLKLIGDSKEAKRASKEIKSVRDFYEGLDKNRQEIADLRIKWAKDDVAFERKLHNMTREDNTRLREELATARERAHQLRGQLTQELGRQTLTGELVVQEPKTRAEQIADVVRAFRPSYYN